MKNQLVIPVLVALVVGGAGGFYGGMKYQASKTPVFGGGRTGGGQGMMQGGARQGQPRNFQGMGGNVGDIISKDDTSVTIKLRDGGSRILFYSPKTVITKTTTGTAAELVVGGTIMARGTANADGSVTAESIQLNPMIPTGAPGAVPALTK
ncbi:MAG: hypothetical protein WCJ29_04310 [bacterium]